MAIPSWQRRTDTSSAVYAWYCVRPAATIPCSKTSEKHGLFITVLQPFPTIHMFHKICYVAQLMVKKSWFRRMCSIALPRNTCLLSSRSTRGRPGDSRSRTLSLYTSKYERRTTWSPSRLCFFILANKSLRASTMTPGFCTVPSIVWVLPAPVAP